MRNTYGIPCSDQTITVICLIVDVTSTSTPGGVQWKASSEEKYKEEVKAVVFYLLVRAPVAKSPPNFFNFNNLTSVASNGFRELLENCAVTLLDTA